MSSLFCRLVFIFFFFNDTATTEIYTLSLHDALSDLPCLPPNRKHGFRKYGTRIEERGDDRHHWPRVATCRLSIRPGPSAFCGRGVLKIETFGRAHSAIQSDCLRKTSEEGGLCAKDDLEFIRTPLQPGWRNDAQGRRFLIAPHLKTLRVDMPRDITARCSQTASQIRTAKVRDQIP